MPEVTRRRLLSSAAAGAGGALASSLLPPALARAAQAGPRHGSLRDVKHVVIHMQENRSFDHYFGTLGGVAGFSDPHALIQTDPTPPFNSVEGKSIFYQYEPKGTAAGENPDGYLLPWHLDTLSTSAQAIPSTSHAWYYQHLALNITVPTTTGQPTTAYNNNWLPAHLMADGDAHGPYTMGYYERQDIPFHFALAETFTVCDHYHCSLLGPTWPNRMYLMTGMIDPDGEYGGPVISNVVPSPATGTPYTWTTYPERLTEAGISWRIYQEEDDYGTNVLEFFEAYQAANPGSPLYEGALTIYPPDRFEWDAKHDRLPTVSWIVPTSGQSEHPSYLPASGANYLASKLNAVAENPNLWNSTVFIVNYDENDGLFDHVVPPLPPAGTPGEFVDAGANTTPASPNWPVGGGVRVPAFVVSPWTVGGYVASEQFDHTSVLQFLEQLTRVQEPNITAWRRKTFGDLTSALGFSNGKSTTFPRTLPNTIGEFWQAENEVETLPAPTIPGASQTPPVQEKRRPPLPWTPQPRPWVQARSRKPLPATRSRAEENRTSHRADFGQGGDKVYLAKIQAVAEKPLIVGTAYAYVPAIVGGAIAIFNTSTFTLASSISSGTTNPYGAAATPDGSEVWVTESGTNTVSVISTTGAKPAITNTVVAGIYPHGIAITPDGKTAYVANTGPNTGPGGSQTLSVIDVASQTPGSPINVGEAPQLVTVSPDGSLVFVTCADGVYVIKAASGNVSKVREPLHQPHGVAFTPDGAQAWVTDSERDEVVVLSTSTLRTLGRIGVGSTPWNTAFNSDGSSAYVTNSNDNTVSVIDTATRRVTDKIKLGSFTYTDAKTTFAQPNQIPTAIALAPDDRYLWVACNVSGSLAIIDTTTNAVTHTAQAGLGTEPTAVTFGSI
jgi:phospholipase C